MSQLLLQSKAEKNRDGTSNTSINLVASRKKVKMEEVWRLENHSTFNQDCGCKELSLVTPITMLTSLPESKIKRTKCGSMMVLHRLSNLLINKIYLLTTEVDMSEFQRLTPDGINSGPIFLLDISKLMLAKVQPPSNTLLSKATKIQK
jgi:hypothetical protein